MLAFIKDCVTEEWQKTTILGKMTWVPLFTVTLTFFFIVVVAMIPLLALVWILEPSVTRCLRLLKRRFKRILFKRPNSTSADQAQKEDM